jgi:hypothetical protein
MEENGKGTTFSRAAKRNQKYPRFSAWGAPLFE